MKYLLVLVLLIEVYFFYRSLVIKEQIKVLTQERDTYKYNFEECAKIYQRL